MEDKVKIQLNKEFGYFELASKPTQDELSSYYGDKYYQEESANYRAYYPEEELVYFKNKIAQKDHVIQSILKHSEEPSILDVGCGEGFTMNYYFEKGYTVKGIDFSDFGIRDNHPHLDEFFVKGNIFDSLNQLAQLNQTFNIIWLDNVLEHVINPQELLKACYQLTKPGGVLVIEVPNDFSKLQSELKKNDLIDREYWVAIPDHLTYFSKESLVKLCASVNWEARKVLGDFPIEWYLTNAHSNYVKDRSVGKEAHQSRIFIENFLHSQAENLDAVNDFYESMANIGQGRQLIGFFVKE